MRRHRGFAVSLAIGIVLVVQSSALAATTNVSATNFVFTPSSVKIKLGDSVAWTNGTTGTQHTSTSDGVNDGDGTAGIALWDSRTIQPGNTFTFQFKFAGGFPYHCTFHQSLGMTGTVKVPVTANPTRGMTSTTFTITWATAAPPSGDVFDVQIERPGNTSFSRWSGHTGITTSSGTFVPNAGTGTYSFRARLRDSMTGAKSGYSPPKSISVS